jgi:molybdenum cofactor biosynthesis enzyme MoaA
MVACWRRYSSTPVGGNLEDDFLARVHQDDAVLSFMTSETFERLLPAIKHIGAVVFSGSGEPLYNKNLLSFIERTRAECPTAHISLTTNGTLLRRDVAAELVRLRVDR